MVEDILIDHADELEEYYEKAKGFSSMAERVIDHIKMRENPDIPYSPDRNIPTERSYARDLLEQAYRNFEMSLDVLQRNTVFQSVEKVYETESPEEGFWLDSGKLWKSLENYMKVLEYAEENGIEVESEFFSLYDDSETLESGTEETIIYG